MDCGLVDSPSEATPNPVIASGPKSAIVLAVVGAFVAAIGATGYAQIGNPTRVIPLAVGLAIGVPSIFFNLAFATSSVRCEPNCIVVRNYFLTTRSDKASISSVEWTARDLALWQAVFFGRASAHMSVIKTLDGAEHPVLVTMSVATRRSFFATQDLESAASKHAAIRRCARS